MPSVAYEDLLSSPEEAMKNVLPVCGLPMSRMIKCVAAMSNDSQVYLKKI